LTHQNNYIERLNINDNARQNFNTLAISLNILHNYFDGPKIIFRAKFLNISVKPVFFIYSHFILS